MGTDKKSEPLNRVDGRAKVTGKAKYFAEFEVPGVTYCVLVTSAITRGTINTINTKDAERAPGVLAVFTHLNMPVIPGWANPANPNAKPPSGGEKYQILGSNKILFNGQPIALVIADTLERAQYAASLVKATYNKATHQTDLLKNTEKAAMPGRFGDYSRGDNKEAHKTAPVTLEADYTVPVEVHNPMELAGILAIWEGEDKVTVYAKTQGVKATQRTLAGAFKLEEKNVSVHSEFVGGGFGMGLRTWPQEVAVVAAARQLKKPVKLVMTREQMFNLVGHRPYTIQRISMGANKDGQLQGIYHEATAETASYDDFTEGTVAMTRFMYACPNVTTKYRIVPLDRGVPIWMRGPGEATGAFALESAIDEMAHKVNMDPVEFRVKNFTLTDPEKNKPFSSNNLKKAYQLGSEKIGWSKRNATPGAVKDGEWLVGYGMSTGVFGAHRGESTCRAQLNADGTLVLQSATSDIGPGTSTAMVQIAHEVTGLPIKQIRFELGDAALPPSGSQGGSATVSSVGSAVYDACMALKGVLADAGLTFEDGAVKPAAGKSAGLPQVLAASNKQFFEITKSSKGGPEQQKYSMYSFSIHFAEVRVHPLTGVVRVKRVVTVADSGRIVSPKTAASQMIGGVTGGIGMALMEEGVIDHRFGRMVNKNLGDYHVPVSADVPHIETIFIDEPDPYSNPMGSKGMGEIALIGFSAAVANAVYNATGKRIRELPITPDKILSA
ncbi:xanthine dehydrogenase family protein molybdopterin-binding subunit [Chitinophaga rhizophila]|uniref:Xanthine dehydrogenase family protein molybdopterin-binding subunit n=1 Tax=Chitinophaga rhizophila TaxID=2866212 RepID=A0ABS7GAI4_9BACT|nr:xanthine dehydrogenase family protein molybdopterin-binding subunit [Chitinophaga rhizophila]MBW8683819.1 xanthine dehydrogenase family protein molybdopterin-binding subunit [Chitinophaga rhizophila]